MPFMSSASLVLGVVFAGSLGGFLFLPPWIFAFMTFAGSLNCGFGDLRNVACHPKPLLIILLLLHVWMPILACAAGHLFFSESYLTAGMIMEFAVPTGILSLVWVTIYGGNVALTLSVIMLDTVLAPFILPLTLKILAGASVQVGVWDMMRGMLLMVAIPALAAMALHDLTKKKLSSWLSPRLSPFSKLAVIPVVAINSTKLAPFFHDVQPVYVSLAAVIFFLALSGYIWAALAARLFRQNEENMVSIFFNASMRNISAGAVIAVQFFPAETVFPVMIGTLFQQVLAAFGGIYLNRRKSRRNLGEKVELPPPIL